MSILTILNVLVVAGVVLCLVYGIYTFLPILHSFLYFIIYRFISKFNKPKIWFFKYYEFEAENHTTFTGSLVLFRWANTSSFLLHFLITFPVQVIVVLSNSFTAMKLHLDMTYLKSEK